MDFATFDQDIANFEDFESASQSSHTSLKKVKSKEQRKSKGDKAEKKRPKNGHKHNGIVNSESDVSDIASLDGTCHEYKLEDGPSDTMTHTQDTVVLSQLQEDQAETKHGLESYNNDYIEYNDEAKHTDEQTVSQFQSDDGDTDADSLREDNTGNAHHGHVVVPADTPNGVRGQVASQRDENGHRKVDSTHESSEFETDNPKNIVKKNLLMAQQAMSRNRSFLADLAIEQETMGTVKSRAMQDLDRTFDLLHERLRRKQEELRDDVQKIYLDNLKALSGTIECRIRQSDDLKYVEHECDKALKENEEENLKLLTEDNKINNVLKEASTNDSNDPGRNYVGFEYNEENHLDGLLNSMIIQHHDKYLPSMIDIQIDSTLVACFETEAYVSVSSCHGYKLDDYDIQVDIFDPDNDCLPCTVTNAQDGMYKVTLRPQISGEHHGMVKVLNKTIPGSQFSFTVESNEPVTVFGGRGQSNGLLMSPRAIAVDENNDIYVADSENHRIQIYNQYGQYVQQFSVAGHTSTCTVFDMAVDSSTGSVICPQLTLTSQLDGTCDTVCFFTKDGQVKEELSYKGILSQALHIAINSQQEIILCDMQKKAVFIIDKSHKLIRPINNDHYKLAGPAYVCIGQDDDIIVTDVPNNCAVVYDAVGNFRFSIGKKGKAKGDLRGPLGVATDVKGRIFVADQFNNRVNIYDNEGQFWGCIESFSDKLFWPRGIATTRDGYVLVTDSENHVIKKYNYM